MHVHVSDRSWTVIKHVWGCKDQFPSLLCAPGAKMWIFIRNFVFILWLLKQLPRCHHKWLKTRVNLLVKIKNEYYCIWSSSVHVWFNRMICMNFGSLQLGAWPMRPPSPINIWLPFWLISGVIYDYSVVMGWLRCSLSISLLHSTIQYIWGAHSSIGHYASPPSMMDLVRLENNLTPQSKNRR